MAHLGGEMKSLLLTLAIMLFDDHLCSYQYCIDHSAQDCSVLSQQDPDKPPRDSSGSLI